MNNIDIILTRNLHDIDTYLCEKKIVSIKTKKPYIRYNREEKSCQYRVNESCQPYNKEYNKEFFIAINNYNIIKRLTRKKWRTGWNS